jgi:hypothetical protein
MVLFTRLIYLNHFCEFLLNIRSKSVANSVRQIFFVVKIFGRVRFNAPDASVILLILLMLVILIKLIIDLYFLADSRGDKT